MTLYSTHFKKNYNHKCTAEKSNVRINNIINFTFANLVLVPNLSIYMLFYNQYHHPWIGTEILLECYVLVHKYTMQT